MCRIQAGCFYLTFYGKPRIQPSYWRPRVIWMQSDCDSQESFSTSWGCMSLIKRTRNQLIWAINSELQRISSAAPAISSPVYVDQKAGFVRVYRRQRGWRLDEGNELLIYCVLEINVTFLIVVITYLREFVTKDIYSQSHWRSTKLCRIEFCLARYERLVADNTAVWLYYMWWMCIRLSCSRQM